MGTGSFDGRYGREHGENMLPRMFGREVVCQARLVHRMPVDNQVYLTRYLFEKPLEERHKNGRLELSLKHHEGQCPPC